MKRKVRPGSFKKRKERIICGPGYLWGGRRVVFEGQRFVMQITCSFSGGGRGPQGQITSLL